MKSYYAVKSSGEIIGVAETAGSFDEETDPTDELNMHHIAKHARDTYTANPEFDKFVIFECACPDSDVSCTCPTKNASKYYADNGTLVAKPLLSVIVDGESSSFYEAKALPIIDRAPGSKVSIALSSTIEDSHIVRLRSGGQVSIIQGDMDLVFASGATQEIKLTAPAQGTSGRVFGQSKYVLPFSITVRGWA